MLYFIVYFPFSETHSSWITPIILLVRSWVLTVLLTEHRRGKLVAERAVGPQKEES